MYLSIFTLTFQMELSHELYDFLRKYKDASNRCLCEFLIRAPSRRLQPDYYEVISAPIDLMKIQVGSLPALFLGHSYYSRL